MTTASTAESIKSATSNNPRKSVIQTPELRFPEFEGEWEEKKFGETVKRSNEKYNPVTDKDEFACIELESLSQETGILLETFNAKKQKSIKNRFHEGEVLFGKLRPYLKKFYKADFDGVCSSEIWVFNGNNTDNNFLYYLLQTEKFNYVINLTIGSKMPRAEWSNISNSYFAFPPLPEQQKIATFLTAVDKRIQLLQKKKEKLEQYKKGAMQKLFSQEIRFKPDDDIKDTDQSRTYRDWEEKRLVEICVINPKCATLPIEFIYIDLESVLQGHLIKREVKNPKNAPSRAQRVVSHGDILYQTVRPYQRNNLFFSFSGDYVASTGYAQLRAKGDPRFLYHLIHTDIFVNKVMNRCTGTSYPAINSSDLAKVKVSFPTLPEQQKIASFLSSIDTAIGKVNAQVDKSKEFKKGLLQKMFV